MLYTTLLKMGNIRQTLLVGGDIRQVSPLPFVNLLFGFPNVLLPAFLARYTIDHIGRFTGDGVSDHECSVGGCYGDRAAEGSKLACVASLVTAFMKTCCFWCGFFLEMT